MKKEKEKSCEELFCLTLAGTQNYQIKSSGCCFPKELVGFDPRHVTSSPPIGKSIWVEMYNRDFSFSFFCELVCVAFGYLEHFAAFWPRSNFKENKKIRRNSQYGGFLSTTHGLSVLLSRVHLFKIIYFFYCFSIVLQGLTEYHSLWSELPV